ncbi:MAG: KAP family P-loop NTPase fold protein [Desulfovibrio sp.]|uniref:KAP family P-loop NTPase fold protein n=1 Tax=Desulfovibrio sp. 7SRBS1 TaxID=3378064 RepID=UPI003B421C2F
MFRKNKPLEATSDDPFKEDKLGREENIIALVEIMKDVQTPLVMTVSADWGSGKTSFIRMWKAYLESQKHPCILFNAWEHDFNNEPLVAFLGEIYEFMDANPANKFEQTKILLRKAGPKVLSALTKIAATAKSYFPVDISPGVHVGLAAAEITTENLSEYFDLICSRHGTLKEQLKKFKESLESFVQTACESGHQAPFYFFVDELDRCEPSYAIQLLETVKHLFSIPGIVFVLAVDKNKLGDMVRVRYGGFSNEEDSTRFADGYLRRFVDVEYEIQEPSIEMFIEYLTEDVYALTDNNDFRQFKDRFYNFIKLFFEKRKTTLRDVENFFVRSYHVLFYSNKEDVSHVNGKFWIIKNEKCSMEDHEFWSYPIEIYIAVCIINVFYPERFKGLVQGINKPRDQPRMLFVEQFYESCIAIKSYMNSGNLNLFPTSSDDDFMDLVKGLCLVEGNRLYLDKKPLFQELCSCIALLDSFSFLEKEEFGDKDAVT